MMRGGLLGRLGLLDNGAMRERTGEAFASSASACRTSSAPVADFSGGQRQGVAVARAVTWASKVVFMDEPTAALGVVQTRTVLDLIRRVRDAGLSVVLISHNMPEVLPWPTASRCCASASASPVQAHRGRRWRTSSAR